jgi:hypothetical protein
VLESASDDHVEERPLAVGNGVDLHDVALGRSRAFPSTW